MKIAQLIDHITPERKYAQLIDHITTDRLAYGIRRNETKQSVFDETKQSLTLEKSGNCSSAAPNTLDTIAVLFR